MHPSREEFTELLCYISELKHQFSHKIDQQSMKINDHSEIVEELLWQVRELSDKLRKMSNKVEDLEKNLAETQKKAQENSCICHYQNHLIPARYRPNRSIFSRQTSMISRKSSTRAPTTVPDKKFSQANGTIDGNGDDDIYETIEFNDSSSSHMYAEPYRTYGSIRRSVNVKSRQMSKPKVTRKSSKTAKNKTLKKSSGMMNLQLLSQSHDEELLIKDDDGENDVELRVKTPVTNDKCLLPDYAVDSNQQSQRTDMPLRHRDASGIFINLEYSKLRTANDEDERTTI